MASPVGPAEGAENLNSQQSFSTSRRPPSNSERLDAIAERVLLHAARHLWVRNRAQLELPLYEQFELFDKPRKK